MTSVEARDWHRSLHRWPDHDVYFLPEYHRAYELNGDGQALAFVAEAAGEALFYPFLLRPIESVGGLPVAEPWHDIETVYGYSGPLATTTDRGFLDAAWDAFSAWCHEQGVVAEFLRFNSLNANLRYADPGLHITQLRETVVLEIASSAEEQWKSYPSTQRNMVRKARSRGLIWREAPLGECFEQFLCLYQETMRRLGFDSYYAFSDAYFASLAEDLGDCLRLFLVNAGKEVAAAALFLVRGEVMHYHLSGSDPRHRGDAPNNLLLHGAASWGREAGCRLLHLGGGITSLPDDPLLRFKRSISRQRLPFHIGKRVHDREAYETLCSQWLKRHGPTTRPDYFLFYRLEKAT